MQKLLKYLLIAAFFAVLILPLGVSLIHGLNTEKLPQLIDDDKKLNTEFDTQMNDFVADNQPFYDSAVFANNFIHSNIMKSETANVITGSNGYYYYSETRDDILHCDTLTDREIYNAAKNLELIHDYCKENNCEFVFTVAPNKATVYPENLPFNFKALSQPSNFEKLEKELEKHNLNYANVKSRLIESEKTTYLKTDTHWNNYGALVAYQEIVRTAGDHIPDELNENPSFYKKKDHNGDLTSMLFENQNDSEEQYYIDSLSDIEASVKIRIRGEKTRKSDELIKKIASKDENYVQIHATSSKSDNNGSLFMLRDSFCRSMFPYFAYSYGKSTFIKSATYDAYVNPCDAYDCFVFEIVERNIKDLLVNEHKIPAQQISEPQIKKNISSKKLADVSVSNEYADYTMVSGHINSALLDNREDVFVQVIDNASGESKCYASFVGKLEKGSYRYYMTTNEFIVENATIQVIVNDTVVAQTAV